MGRKNLVSMKARHCHLLKSADNVEVLSWNSFPLENEILSN
jgi:hypothetical protein